MQSEKRTNTAMFHTTKTILEAAHLEPTKTRLAQAKSLRSVYGAKFLEEVANLVKVHHSNANIEDAAEAFVQLGKNTGFDIRHTDGDRKTAASLFRAVAKLHPEASLSDTMRAFRKFDGTLVKQVLKDLGDGKANGSVYNVAKLRARK